MSIFKILISITLFFMTHRFQMNKKVSENRSIWIVDDSPTDADRAKRVLSSVGYKVEHFSDGATALERLSASSSPDLLILDWMMPGITGIEVCSYLRSMPSKVSKIPVILLTAQHGPEEINQAFASGANDYVAKPFVEDELKARVEALIQNKRLLERAEQAEADVRAIMSNAPDAIFVIDHLGKITFANQEAQNIFKLPNNEIIGNDFQILFPGMTLQNISVAPGEAMLPLPDLKVEGHIYSPSLRVSSADNDFIYTVVLRDVTARRNSDIRRLDFYSMIAHDLRTPITSVLLRLGIALRGKDGNLPTKHIENLKKSETSLRSLTGMITDFLELARMENIGQQIEPTRIDLSEITQMTMDELSPLLEKSELIWIDETKNENHHVFGDHRRMSQVISNLIGNAIKFTPNGGIITTSISATNNFVQMTIKDTGRGIPQHEIPTLFDRFTRATETAGESIGSGLGLMIVREIIQAHGGSIGVESVVGVGSKFWFKIPTTPDTSTPH
jgi:signal transduction histidine kinase